MRNDKEIEKIAETLTLICQKSSTKKEAEDAIRKKYPENDFSDILPAFRPFINIGD